MIVKLDTSNRVEDNEPKLFLAMASEQHWSFWRFDVFAISSARLPNILLSREDIFIKDRKAGHSLELGSVMK